MDLRRQCLFSNTFSGHHLHPSPVLCLNPVTQTSSFSFLSHHTPVPVWISTSSCTIPYNSGKLFQFVFSSVIRYFFRKAPFFVFSFKFWLMFVTLFTPLICIYSNSSCLPSVMKVSIFINNTSMKFKNKYLKRFKSILDTYLNSRLY